MLNASPFLPSFLSFSHFFLSSRRRLSTHCSCTWSIRPMHLNRIEVSIIVLVQRRISGDVSLARDWVELLFFFYLILHPGPSTEEEVEQRGSSSEGVNSSYILSSGCTWFR